MKKIYASLRLDYLKEGLKTINELKLGLELVFAPEDLFYKELKIDFDKFDIPENKTAHLPFYGLQLGSKNPYISQLSVDIIKKAITIASQLGIKKGVFHPALNPMIPHNGIKHWYVNFKNDLTELLEHSYKHNFELIAENTWEANGTIFEWLNNDFKQLRYCLDIAHVYCFANKNFDYWLKLFEGRISHMHLSDNDYSNDSHSALGTKTIDFSQIPKDIDFTLEVDPWLLKQSLAHLQKIGII